MNSMSVTVRKHHIAGYEFRNLGGLSCTADAAQRLGRIDEAGVL